MRIAIQPCQPDPKNPSRSANLKLACSKAASVRADVGRDGQALSQASSDQTIGFRGSPAKPNWDGMLVRLREQDKTGLVADLSNSGTHDDLSQARAIEPPDCST